MLTNKELREIVDIGSALTTEKNKKYTKSNKTTKEIKYVVCLYCYDNFMLD